MTELELQNRTKDTQNMFSLTEEEKLQAKKFSEDIDLLNILQILQYGSAAQKKVMDFSDSSLRSLPSKELEEITEEMKKLIKELQKFSKDFDRNTGEDFMTLYDRCERKVSEAQRRMEIHYDALLRHIRQLNDSYNKVVRNIREFDLYILAGNYSLDRCMTEILPSLPKTKSGAELTLLVKDYEDGMIRMKKKIDDLSISREIPFSALSQIRVIQNNDALMAENLKKLYINGIPLWKQRMILASGLKGTQSGTDSKIFHETNDLLISTLQKLAKIQNQANEEREKLFHVYSK